VAANNDTLEKMQAITGPWPKFIREIADEYYYDGIDDLDINNTRARDFQNLARAIYCIDQLPQQHHGTPQEMERWFDKPDGPSPQTTHLIKDTFRVFKAIVEDKALRKAAKGAGITSRIAPVEFVMAAVMIAVHKQRLSLFALAKGFGILRKETRKEFVDIRANTRIFKKMYSIINGEIARLSNPPGEEAAGQAKPPAGSTAAGTKRKREEPNNDTDEDAEPGEPGYRPPKTKPPPNRSNMNSTRPRSPTVSSHLSSSRSPIQTNNTQPVSRKCSPVYIPDSSGKHHLGPTPSPSVEVHNGSRPKIRTNELCKARTNGCTIKICLDVV